MWKKNAEALIYIQDPNIKLAYIVGMHFSQSVSIIQSQVGVIRGVQVLYSDTVSKLNAMLKHETYILKHNAY